MLLVHLALSILPETCFTRIPKAREKNMSEHHNAWTINKSYSADPRLTTTLEGRFLANCGKQPKSEVVGKSAVWAVCLVQCLRGNSRRVLWELYWIVWRRQPRNHAWESPFSCNMVMKITFSRFGLAFFFHPLCESKLAVRVSVEILIESCVSSI
jgi:hypothetical protein